MHRSHHLTLTLLSLVVSYALSFAYPSVTYAAAPVPPTVQELVYRAANRNHVDAELMWRVISTCEDPSLDPAAQSAVIDRKGPNGRENSWGIAQIDLDYHPELTRAEVTDPAFAADWMATEFSHGHATSWTCYNRIASGR